VRLHGVVTPLEHAAFSPDGNLLVAMGEDGIARIWRAATGKFDEEINCGGEDGCYSATFSPSGRLVATAGERSNKSVRIWSIAERRTIQSFNVKLKSNQRPYRIWSVSLSPSGGLLVMASEAKPPGNATIWNVANGRLKQAIPGHSDYVYSGVFSSDGSKVVTVSKDGTMRIWNVATRKPLLKNPKPVKTADTVVPLFDAAFSHDNKLVVTAGYDGYAYIWDARTGKLLRGTLERSGKRLISAAFSRDGKYVLTTSRDGTARIFDTETGQRVGVVPGFDGWILAATFLPGKPVRIRFVGQDGIVHVETCDACPAIDELLKRAPNRIRSTLTTNEQKQASSLR